MKGFFGELIGTFILVFIGCGSVAWAVLVEPLELIQIATIWGIGVCLAIICSSPFSKAHLNPAVSLAFLITKDLPKKDLIPYLLGQFAGAFVAAGALYLLFIEPATIKTVDSGMMFGEYYPNPGNADLKSLSMPMAMLVEGLGTFLLMFGIYLIISLKLKKGWIMNPILIGGLLTVLIYAFAPFTQCGLNPARDLSPRLFSYLFGWKDAFAYNGVGWLTVYVVAPIMGGILAAFVRKYTLKK